MPQPVSNSDLVQRLRTAAERCKGIFDEGFYNPWLEAADEIERLHKELDTIHAVGFRDGCEAEKARHR